MSIVFCLNVNDLVLIVKKSVTILSGNENKLSADDRRYVVYRV